MADKTSNSELVAKLARAEAEIEDLKRRQLAHVENWGAAFTSGNAAVIAADGDGIIELFSEGAEVILGYASTDVLGQHISTLCPPNKVDEQAVFRKQKGNNTFESERLKSDGTIIPLEFSLAYRYDAEGKSKGTIVMIRDISERKRKEEALELSEERLKLAMSVINDGLFDWNVTTNEVFFDPRYYTMAGHEPDEYPGVFEEFVKRIHPDERGQMQLEIEDYLAGHTEEFDVEFRFRRKDKSWMWTRGRVKIVERDSQGRAVRLVGTHTDISGLKEAEAAHLLLEENLRRVQKMEAIGLLAGGVAHDFNNMLSAILCTTELAQQSVPADDSVQEFLSEILNASKRAANLTQQLLAFSRQQLTQPKVIHLGQCVSAIIPILQSTMGESIILSADTVGQEGLVRVDPAQIEQAVINLALNAKDAMPGGGMLQIATADRFFNQLEASVDGLSEPGYYVTMSVCDSGTGIEESVQEKMFDPFFTTKEVGKGTGLGLSSVLGSIEQNGGHLHLKSTLGEGTCFTVIFPRVEAARDTRTKRSSKVVGGTETILVVEDERMLRKVAVKILKKWGYNVLSAASGPEALELVRNVDTEIHLLLSDVVMPHMSGPELVKEFLKLRPGTKVLFVSGYNDESIVDQGIVHEKVNLLAKPYSVESLAKSVRDIMGPSTA